MSKTKFTKGLSSENPINLWLGVSLDNSRLRGDNLAKFVKLINRHVSKIKHLYVVVGCEIYGHYVGKEMAKVMGDKWVEEAGEYINKQKLKIPFKFVRWSELTVTEQYANLLIQIQKDYQIDVNFRAIVDNLSEEFKKRKNCKIENARSYLLDECAVYLMFDGKTTYPSKELNLALQYVITKYKKPEELEYIGYEVGNEDVAKESNSKEKTQVKLLEVLEDQSQKMIEQAKLIDDLRQQVLELRSLMLILVKKDSQESSKLIIESSKSITLDDEQISPNRIKVGLF